VAPVTTLATAQLLELYFATVAKSAKAQDSPSRAGEFGVSFVWQTSALTVMSVAFLYQMPPWKLLAVQPASE
jgi:hypothetical protein